MAYSMTNSQAPVKPELWSPVPSRHLNNYDMELGKLLTAGVDIWR